MNLSEYASFDAVGLAELVRQKSVTAADLIDAANSAMDAVNTALNAVIARVDPPLDMDPGGSGGPFSGVPFLLKDLGHGWSGIPCNMGSRLAEGYVSKQDSVFAGRLRASGLIPVGRTNTPEFGVNGTTEPQLTGATSNPWDTARSPGGSSGGAAAAVAAGIVPFAHASDGGGSIRMPAAWCGLVGLKPSRGRNPLGPEAGEPANSIVAHHVVSRSVRDTAAALDVTAGPAGGDFIPLASPDHPYLDAIETPPEQLRIALCTRFLDAPEPEGPCVEAAVAAARLCEGLGHQVTEVTPDVPYPEMATLSFDLYAATLVNRIEQIARRTGRTPGSATLERQTLATLKKGRVMTALDLIDRFNRQTAMSHAISRFMHDYDLILTPGVSRVPCMTGEFTPEEHEDDDLGYWEREMACYTFSALPSITGQPALVLPLYWTVSGLPVGAQLIGPIGDDVTVLKLARQLEQAKPWADKRPPVHAGEH